MNRMPICTWALKLNSSSARADHAAQFRSERGRSAKSSAGASSSDSLSLMLSATGK